ASRHREKVLMVGYSIRFHPLMQHLKELIQHKTYGEVFQVSIYTEQLAEYLHHPGGDSAAGALGGGSFYKYGYHAVDLMLWLLGRPLRGTYMGTRYGTPWTEQEGTSNIAIEFDNGA